MAGITVAHANLVGRDEHEAHLVDAAPAGPAEHLEDFVGLERLLDVIAAVGVAGERDAAQGKIDAGGQAHGGDDDAELAGLGERLDDPGARAVAQPAVMICEAALQQLGQVFACQKFLLGTELKRIRCGQVTGQFGGERFGGLAAGSENQDGSEVLGEGLCHQARPIAADFAGQMKVQIVRLNFLEGNRPLIVFDQDPFTTEPAKPLYQIVRIGHAAAEQEQLGRGRRERDGEFVVQAAVRVAQHLVLVHDEQRGSVAFDEAAFLRLERGDDYGRVEVFREVAGRDADLPAARAPLGELVVGQRAGRDSVNGLAVFFPLVRPQFEDEGFAGASGRVHDDILSLAQGGDGLLLPDVRHDHLVQNGQAFELFRERQHDEKIIEDAKCETGKFSQRSAELRHTWRRHDDPDQPTARALLCGRFNRANPVNRRVEFAP